MVLEHSYYFTDDLHVNFKIWCLNLICIDLHGKLKIAMMSSPTSSVKRVALISVHQSPLYKYNFMKAAHFHIHIFILQKESKQYQYTEAIYCNYYPYTPYKTLPYILWLYNNQDGDISISAPLQMDPTLSLSPVQNWKFTRPHLYTICAGRKKVAKGCYWK